MGSLVYNMGIIVTPIMKTNKGDLLIGKITEYNDAIELIDDNNFKNIKHITKTYVTTNLIFEIDLFSYDFETTKKLVEKSPIKYEDIRLGIDRIDQSEYLYHADNINKFGFLIDIQKCFIDNINNESFKYLLNKDFDKEKYKNDFDNYYSYEIWYFDFEYSAFIKSIKKFYRLKYYNDKIHIIKNVINEN